MLVEAANLEATGLLARIVRPRGDWFGIRKICGLLGVILEDLDNFSSGLFCQSRLEGLVALLANTESSRGLIDLTEKPQGISGLMTEHPQHAGLLKVAELGDLSEHRLRLVVWVIICTDRWEHRIEALGRDNEKYEGKRRELDARLYEAWLGIRKLSDEALAFLDGSLSDLQALAGRLVELVRDYDSRTFDRRTRDYFGGLERYFAYFGEIRQGRDIRLRERTNSKTLRLEFVEDGFEIDPEAELTPPFANRTRSMQPLESQRKTSHYLSGNSLDELTDGPTLWQGESSIQPELGGSLQGAILNSRAQQGYRKRAAQRLPGRWEELTDNELYIWLSEVRLRLSCDKQLAIAMLILLLSGRPVSSVLSARVVRVSKQIPGQLDSSALYIDASQRSLRSGVMRPKERRRREDGWKHVLHDHDTDVTLPIPMVFWEWMETFVAPILGRSKKRSAALFTKLEGVKIQEKLSKVKSMLCQGKRSRITLHRVGHHLLSELIKVGGDRVEASLLTGQEMPSGHSAALYYHSCNKEKLAGLYRKATSRWAGWFPGEVAAVPVAQPLLFSGSVGSDLVLKSRSHRKLVVDFQRQLEVDRECLVSSEGVVRFHNSFVNYSLLFLFYGTGYRAVRDPISRETDIDFDQGVLVIADKTGDGFGHSRIVPLTEGLQKQLVFLRAHNHWLKAQLKWCGLLDEHDAPFIIYLSPELKPVQVTPKTVAEHFKWAYPLPLNLSRHWLRTELRAKGVSGAYVDYFMGHWFAGREPWAKFSCSDPLDYTDAIRPALNELLTEQGFIPLRGAV